MNNQECLDQNTRNNINNLILDYQQLYGADIKLDDLVVKRPGFQFRRGGGIFDFWKKKPSAPVIQEKVAERTKYDDILDNYNCAQIQTLSSNLRQDISEAMEDRYQNESNAYLSDPKNAQLYAERYAVKRGGRKSKRRKTTRTKTKKRRRGRRS